MNWTPKKATFVKYNSCIAGAEVQGRSSNHGLNNYGEPQ